MTQDVVSLLFAGDSHDLLPRYQDGVRRYREGGGPAPESVVVAHGDEGLIVTLVWGEGVDHEHLGSHMGALIDELGLPFPQVAHGALVTASWADLTGAVS